MAVTVMIFGSLTDVIGESIELEKIADTNTLISELNERFPALQHSKYLVAVNKKMINENIKLNGNETVALMSPFSGG